MNFLWVFSSNCPNLLNSVFTAPNTSHTSELLFSIAKVLKPICKLFSKADKVVGPAIIILYSIWMIFYAPLWVNPDNLMGTLLKIPIGYFVLWYLAGVIVGGSLLFLCRNIKSKYLLSLAIFLYLIGEFT